MSEKERDKVLELLAEAAGEGVVVKPVQSAPKLGAFVAPHLVRGIEHSSVPTRNEIFGPVAPIVEFESTDDAVRMANDTEFGLMSYGYAPDPGPGRMSLGAWNPAWSQSAADSPPTQRHRSVVRRTPA